MILGNNFNISERAEFEALGAGIKTKRGSHLAPTFCFKRHAFNKIYF